MSGKDRTLVQARQFGKTVLSLRAALSALGIPDENVDALVRGTFGAESGAELDAVHGGPVNRYTPRPVPNALDRVHANRYRNAGLDVALDDLLARWDAFRAAPAPMVTPGDATYTHLACAVERVRRARGAP